MFSLGTRYLNVCRPSLTSAHHVLALNPPNPSARVHVECAGRRPIPSAEPHHRPKLLQLRAERRRKVGSHIRNEPNMGRREEHARRACRVNPPAAELSSTHVTGIAHDRVVRGDGGTGLVVHLEVVDDQHACRQRGRWWAHRAWLPAPGRRGRWVGDGRRTWRTDRCWWWFASGSRSLLSIQCGGRGTVPRIKRFRAHT